MIRASLTGLIDLSKADFLDRKWWQRVYWVLDFVERELTTTLYDKQLDNILGLIQSTQDNQQYNVHLDRFQALWNKWLQIRCPWMQLGPTSLKDQAEVLRQQYIKAFGDPNDPAYRAEMQRLIDYWRSVRHGRN